MNKLSPGISLKTRLEIERMRTPARTLARLFRDTAGIIRPGVTTKTLEAYWTDALSVCKAKAIMHGYNGFPATISCSVNDVAVHGIPDDSILKDGDLVTIDVMIEKDGWCSDSAWTYSVGRPSPEGTALRNAAWRCCLAGVKAAGPGKSIQTIAESIERTAKTLGCTICDRFCGHGIGKKVHEDPIVPHTGGHGSFVTIVPGMVINIEPVVTFGSGRTELDPDGWSHRTVDGRITAQFEHTVAIKKSGLEILTLENNGRLQHTPDAPY
jgi:methionyl aminopeptidase